MLKPTQTILQRKEKKKLVPDLLSKLNLNTSSERSTAMFHKVQYLVLSILACLFFANLACAEQIFSRFHPAFYSFYGNPLDHTYVCVHQTGTPDQCFALPGSNSGGAILADTYGTGAGSKTRCVAAAKECTIYWGKNGTCQQGANRMLLVGNGRNVSKAGGYKLSSWFFGSLGPNSLTCINKCR
jgi:hypothetical protein